MKCIRIFHLYFVGMCDVHIINVDVEHFPIATAHISATKHAKYVAHAITQTTTEYLYFTSICCSLHSLCPSHFQCADFSCTTKYLCACICSVHRTKAYKIKYDIIAVHCMFVRPIYLLSTDAISFDLRRKWNNLVKTYSIKLNSTLKA